MRIQRNHSVGKQEARRRIDNFLNNLMRREFPGGVKVKNPEKDWSGDSITFSFKAKKGSIGTTISGVIQVSCQDLLG